MKSPQLNGFLALLQAAGISYVLSPTGQPGGYSAKFLRPHDPPVMGFVQDSERDGYQLYLQLPGLSIAGDVEAIKANGRPDPLPDLLAAARALLANADFADGQGVILTHDAEALERAIARAEGGAA